MNLLRRIACFFVGHDYVEGPVEREFSWLPYVAAELYRKDHCDRCGRVAPVYVGLEWSDDAWTNGAVL